MSTQIQEVIGGAAANKIVGTGSAVTVVSWASSSDFGVWAGILIGVVGLAINLYYKRKSDKRASEAHAFYLSRNAYQTNPLTFRPPHEEEVADGEDTGATGKSS